MIIFNWCFENNVSNFVFIFCNYVPWIFTLTRIDLLSQKKKTRIDLYWVLKNRDVMYGKHFVYYRSYGSNESRCSRCKKFYILQSNWPKLSNFFILFLSLHIHIQKKVLKSHNHASIKMNIRFDLGARLVIMRRVLFWTSLSVWWLLEDFFKQDYFL